jgi:hypothetical protein
MDNFERAKGESSEWRTPKFIFDALGLKFVVDPCGPENGYYAVPAARVFTKRDNGLLLPWGDGIAFVNPPWSEHRGAVVPWLHRYFAHPCGGIFVCVARTSCDWWHELVLPRAELILFPTGKTRFIKPDGSPGPSPTNGIALIGKGEVACKALRRSGLGYCLTVDRSAAPSTRANNVVTSAQIGERMRGGVPFSLGDAS